nr:hypothetical protein [Tanacetum cinerariifolium]
VQRSAMSEAKRENIRKHGIESSNKNLDGDHEVDLQQALRLHYEYRQRHYRTVIRSTTAAWALTSDIDSRTSCPTTRTGPMPMEVTTVVRQ